MRATKLYIKLVVNIGKLIISIGYCDTSFPDNEWGGMEQECMVVRWRLDRAECCEPMQIFINEEEDVYSVEPDEEEQAALNGIFSFLVEDLKLPRVEVCKDNEQEEFFQSSELHEGESEIPF